MKKVDNKNSNKNLKIIIVMVALITVISISFAYIGKVIVDNSSKANVNIGAKALANSVLDVTNASLSITVDPKGMSQTNSEKYSSLNNSNMQVSLLTGSSEYTISCTYDISFTYDNDSSIYGVSPTPVTTGATNELTLKITGPSTGTNLYASEKNFNLTSKTKSVVTGIVITNNSVSSKTIQTWNFTNTFYNLNLDQSALANKTFKGKYHVTNAKCTMQ